jgi:carbon-monoxide dehydrogenase large subunit
MPRIHDTPKKQKVIFVETPEQRGPFGARCVAEHPMVAVAPTILNALYDATGHDFFRLPVFAKDILEVLQ